MMEAKGATLSFHDVKYEIHAGKTVLCKKQNTKTILHGLSGVMRPGVNAILGPTGSGKTSLLDVLAGRVDQHALLSGKVLLNGKEIKGSTLRTSTGYVVQDDVVMGTLTVRENILFSAHMRLPANKYSNEEKIVKVEKIIEDLKLNACADSRVGNEFCRGISGGERKRTAIGVELIMDPSVLFLDEPTTGLDAYTAVSIVKLLSSLGNNGRTIILSIHQPRYSIFTLFDHLVILSRGQMAYTGPASSTVDYFSSIGFTCPRYHNPADYFMDVVNGEIQMETSTCRNIKELISTKRSTGSDASIAIEDEKPEAEKEAVAKLLVDIFTTSNIAEDETLKLKEIEKKFYSSTQSINSSDIITQRTCIHNNGFYHQLHHLMKRTCKDLVRNPVTSILPIILASMIGFIVGVIFFKLEPLHIGIQGRAGVVFFIVTTQVMNCVQALEVFIQKRKIFLHESAAGYYRTSAYFIARVAADLIPNRWIPIMFLSGITYFMTGFQLDVGKFFFYYLSIALSGTTAASMAFAVSSSFEVYGVATLFLTVPCFIMMLFGGFLINTDGILHWLEWLKYFSIMRYGMNGILANELSGMVFVDDHSLLQMNSTNPCCNEALNYTITNCKTGDEYLRDQHIPFDTWGIWQNIVALAAMTSCFLALAYFQLRRTRKFQ